MSHSRIPAFYKFSVANRLRVLLEREVISETEYDMLMDGTHLLDADKADRLIENVIGAHYTHSFTISRGGLLKTSGRDIRYRSMVDRGSRR